MSARKQGPKGGQAAASRQAAERAAARASARKRLAMLVLGVALIATFVIVAVAQGIGDPSVGEGEVAVIEDAPDGTITTEDFDAALEQTAAQQQIRQVPDPGDPQYELLADGAVNLLILERWVLGEAEERGIEVSEREIDEELDSLREQPQLDTEKEFQDFLEQSGFTIEQARRQIMLGLLSERLQQAVVPEEPEIADEQVEDFYDANIEQFQMSETRDVRVITTKSEADAGEVLSQLEADDSPKSFEEVAREFSTDEATKSTGGLREGVAEGESEPALEEQIFAAPEGEFVGPFETESGFGVLRVEAINEASTTPLDDAVREQILTSLRSARGQEIAQAFQEDFSTKWIARTFCAEEFQIDRCANADPPPDACTEEVADSQGCDAPVPSTRPIPPGSSGVFGTPPPTGLAQGPCAWLDPEQFPGRACDAWPLKEVDPNALPPGGFTPGITPVPGAPPGAAPPAAPPPAVTPPPGG